MKMLTLRSTGLVLVLTLFASGCSNPKFSELQDKPFASGIPSTDDKAPTIIWVQVPDDTTAGSTVNIEYDIIEGTSPIISIICKVDGVVVPCSEEGDRIVIEDVVSGDHNFEIVVTFLGHGKHLDSKFA
mgnify:CR=1 FL=1